MDFDQDRKYRALASRFSVSSPMRLLAITGCTAACFLLGGALPGVVFLAGAAIGSFSLEA